MKAIMKKIKPKTCSNIMNLIQSILVIKDKREATAIQKLIDEYEYAEIYGYCSYDKKSKVFGFADRYSVDFIISDRHRDTGLSGYVVFKFRCYKIEEIYYQRVFEANPLHLLEEESGYGTDTLCADEFIKNTCLTSKELENYLNTDKPNKKAYAIHISDLEIFDKPKELNEFHGKGYLDYIKPCEHPRYPETYKDFHKSVLKVAEHKFKLTKAPQNFCYVEVKRDV